MLGGSSLALLHMKALSSFRLSVRKRLIRTFPSAPIINGMRFEDRIFPGRYSSGIGLEGQKNWPQHGLRSFGCGATGACVSGLLARAAWGNC